MAKAKCFSILIILALVVSPGLTMLTSGEVLAQPMEYWAKTYGGDDMDVARSIQQTQDGGYLVAGFTESFGAGSAALWALKLDSNGDVQW